MTSTELRFYEELNDFLAPERRKRAFIHECARAATVKNVIEALGVPHTEVELVLANGESVDFGYLVRHGDRISVYPQFEAFDVTPLLRLRPAPLRHTRFVADAHLGALAKYLRVLGFDTLYRNDYQDNEVAGIAERESRIVLSRDRGLLMRRSITHGCFVRATRPLAQIEEILRRLDLGRSVRPFTRCLVCNTELETLGRDEASARVPEGTAGYYEEFHICRGCDRVYWAGSHFRNLNRVLNRVVSNSAVNPGLQAGKMGTDLFSK